jgi:hypothetical protein
MPFLTGREKTNGGIFVTKIEFESVMGLPVLILLKNRFLEVHVRTLLKI